VGSFKTRRTGALPDDKQTRYEPGDTGSHNRSGRFAYKNVPLWGVKTQFIDKANSIKITTVANKASYTV
jgi:hypothetical protein